jgi:hypothetical protein
LAAFVGEHLSIRWKQWRGRRGRKVGEEGEQREQVRREQDRLERFSTADSFGWRRRRGRERGGRESGEQRS